MQIAAISTIKSLVNFFLFNYKVGARSTMMRDLDRSTTREATMVVIKRQEPRMEPMDM